ncbi:MAG: diacylglycerol/lipid kinase family protein [Sphingomonas sp.]
MPGLMHGLVVHRDITAAANTKRVLERRLSPPALSAVGRRRIGIISNARAHRNHLRGAEPKVDPVLAPDVLYRSPRTLPSLSRALLDFAEAQVELLIVCGGDGTVRDVITCASSIFTGRLPRMAVVPAGKTNALALDLGIPVDWTLADALAAAEGGRIEARSPIEVLRPGSVTADLRGFLFGAGAFVRGTGLAQRTHRAGAFSGLAVGLSLGWGVAQTLFGGRDNMWRAGEGGGRRPRPGGGSARGC